MSFQVQSKAYSSLASGASILRQYTKPTRLKEESQAQPSRLNVLENGILAVTTADSAFMAKRVTAESAFSSGKIRFWAVCEAESAFFWGASTADSAVAPDTRRFLNFWSHYIKWWLLFIMDEQFFSLVNFWVFFSVLFYFH